MAKGSQMKFFGLALGLACAFLFSAPVYASKGDLPKTVKGATYVGTETCATCHDKEYKEYKLSTHARISNEKMEGTAQGCEMCHGPGSVHADASGGKDNIINPKKNPEICFTCHMEKKMEFRLPYHHPVLEGKMSCADCHDPHGPDVRAWSPTGESMNETCFKCHKDQRGPFVFEHDALKDGCASCHKVHGSINKKLLVVRDNNLCLRCHTQTNFPTIGNNNHSAATQSRLNEATCFSAGCHTAPHGSNFDAHLRY